MGDAAHAESFEHEIFAKPFAVKPPTEEYETPDNYRRFPDGDKLPDKMKVWLVQNTGKTFGGVVSRAFGFEDSPDAEILVKGYNRGKEYGAAGIGRHGNFLQWGYHAPPSQMTEPGQKLFLNCIVYIHKFDGKGPLVRKQSSDRTNALRLAAVITRISGDKKEFFERIFPPELWDKYGQDPDGLTQYYKERFEFIYRDKCFRIDDTLKSLGLKSNRTPETLEALIGMLSDPAKASDARKLLKRYTIEDFETPEQWQTWFTESKSRIYFTDTGGYKFLVVPKDYLLDISHISD